MNLHHGATRAKWPALLLPVLLAPWACTPVPPAATPTQEPVSQAAVASQEPTSSQAETAVSPASEPDDGADDSAPPAPEPPTAESSSVDAGAVDFATVNFATDVQPILEAGCRPCHFEGGKMYGKLPFDRPETLHTLGERLFTRIKDEEDQAVIRKFLAQAGEPTAEAGPPGERS